MNGKKTLYLCMGSACHQAGGYKLIPALEALIRQHGLAERLELKGAFCLDRCAAGGALKFEDCVVTGLSAATLATQFRTEILPHLQTD